MEIEKTMVKMLTAKEFADISITQITNQAQVSRSSFYRNYTSKEDIIIGLIQRKLTEWQENYHRNPNKNTSNPYIAMWSSLFNFLRLDKDFYTLLELRGIFYLVEKSISRIIEIDKDETDDLIFFRAFITFGLYGWIKSWVKKGMPDDQSKKIVHLLSQLS